MNTTTDSQRSADCAVRVGPETTASPPRRLTDWGRVLLAVPMTFAFALAPGLVGMVPGIGALPGNLTSDAVVVAVSWGFYAIALLTAVVLVRIAMRYVDRRPFRDSGWTRDARALPALAIGLAATVALVVPVAVLVQATGVLRPTSSPAAGQPTWVVVLVALAMAFLLQGIPEELVWRGYVLQTLRTPQATSVLISATVFAVLHLFSSGGQTSLWERFVYLLIPFGFSLLAGALLLITGSLWAAIGVHAGFHVATLISTTWLGVGNGPALWAATGLVLSAVGAVLLRRWAVTRG